MLLLFACTSGGEVADYSLALRPVFPSNQEPFQYAQDVRLSLEQDGEQVAEARLAEVPGSGESSSADGLPALADTSVRVEALGASEVLAWGRTAPLTADHGEVEAPIFIAETESFGWLGGVAEANAQAAMVPAGNGRFYLAGGIGSLGSSSKKADNRLFVLDLLASDALPTFLEVGELPEYEDGEARRAGATFEVVEEAGTGRRLGMLIGGSNKWFGGNNTLTTYSVNLLDLETGAWDEDPLSHGQMLNTPRFGHVSTVNSSGQVVVAGGWQSDGEGALPIDEVEVYNANERDFYSASSTPSDVGSFGLALAPLGDDGAILCGGGLLGSGNTWSATNGCVRVATTRELKTDVSDLEDAVAAAAVVATDDDHVVLVGGAITSDSVDIGIGSGTAVETVQEYDRLTDTWTTHPGALVYARAGARAVQVAPDKLLVFGGGKGWDPIYGASDALACAELLDTVTFTSEALSACTDSAESGDLPAAVGEPAWAWDEEFGVVVAGGSRDDGSEAVGVSTAAIWLAARQP